MLSRKMIILFPLIIWVAISLGIYSGCFVSIINDSIKDTAKKTENEKTALAMFTMIALGIGEIAGSITSGIIIDKLGYKIEVFFLMVFTGIAFGLLIIIN